MGEIKSQQPIKIPGDSKHWAVISVEDYDSAMGFINNTFNRSLVVALILLIISVLIMYNTTKKIINPIEDITVTLKQLGDLNFKNINTNINKHLVRKDEIGLMASSVLYMGNSVSEFITEIQKFSEEIAKTSADLESTSTKATQTSSEVSRAVEEIAEGASSQARDTDETKNNIEMLGSMLDQEINHIKELNEASRNIDSNKDEGTLILKDLIKNTEEVSTSFIYPRFSFLNLK